MILVHTTSHRFCRGLGFELSLPPFPSALYTLGLVTTGEPSSASGLQLQVIDVLLRRALRIGTDPGMLAALMGKEKV